MANEKRARDFSASKAFSFGFRANDEPNMGTVVRRFVESAVVLRFVAGLVGRRVRRHYYFFFTLLLVRRDFLPRLSSSSAEDPGRLCATVSETRKFLVFRRRAKILVFRFF